jgi:hypothetical protein
MMQFKVDTIAKCHMLSFQVKNRRRKNLLFQFYAPTKYMCRRRKVTNGKPDNL